MIIEIYYIIPAVDVYCFKILNDRMFVFYPEKELRDQCPCSLIGTLIT